mmetsp:Transcript_19218/g.61841  ORF Transcript_19218/g.61841 Transcript_19218/m.61841 type:complete len:213 (+) Transcript_19218:1251-1889(+)
MPKQLLRRRLIIDQHRKRQDGPDVRLRSAGVLRYLLVAKLILGLLRPVTAQQRVDRGGQRIHRDLPADLRIALGRLRKTRFDEIRRDENIPEALAVGSIGFRWRRTPRKADREHQLDPFELQQDPQDDGVRVEDTLMRLADDDEAPSELPDLHRDSVDGARISFHLFEPVQDSIQFGVGRRDNQYRRLRQIRLSVLPWTARGIIVMIGDRRI